MCFYRKKAPSGGAAKSKEAVNDAIRKGASVSSFIHMHTHTTLRRHSRFRLPLLDCEMDR